MNILIISTLCHLFSIIPIIDYYYKNDFIFQYINVIVLSVFLSILYHFYNESNCIILFLDYCVSFIWFFNDMNFRYDNYDVFYKILICNCVSFIYNLSIRYNKHYYFNHSIWHIFNAFKCYYVSSIICDQLKF